MHDELILGAYVFILLKILPTYSSGDYVVVITQVGTVETGKNNYFVSL